MSSVSKHISPYTAHFKYVSLSIFSSLQAYWHIFGRFNVSDVNLIRFFKANGRIGEDEHPDCLRQSCITIMRKTHYRLLTHLRDFEAASSRVPFGGGGVLVPPWSYPRVLYQSTPSFRSPLTPALVFSHVYAMTEEPTSPRASLIEQLPVDLIQRVLCSLPNLSSLKNAALCCAAIFRAFKGAESIITTRISTNQISSDVLPEAIVAYESSRLQSSSLQNVKENFAAAYLRKRPSLQREWTLNSALPVEQLHVYVSSLAQIFMNQAMAKKPFNGPESPAPTHAEVCRFERALYRFEI